VAWFYKDAVMSAMLFGITVFLSPNLMYHILNGGDYISNSIYILVFTVMMVTTIRRPAPEFLKVSSAILLGIALSSRFNFVLLVPLFFFALVKQENFRTAVKYIGIVLLAFSLVTLPFLFYDPINFSPLHTVNKLRLGNGILRFAPMAIPALGGLLALWLGLRIKIPLLPSLIRDCYFVQTVLIVAGFLLALVVEGQSYGGYYPHFGILFMFFGLFAFGPPLLPRAR
jgi:hypothetical protein